MTDLKVIEFKSEEQTWNEGVEADTIKMLEDWLADAKTGKFDAVVICGVRKDGSVDTNVAQHNAHPTIIGAVALLLARLTRQDAEA